MRISSSVILFFHFFIRLIRGMVNTIAVSWADQSTSFLLEKLLRDYNKNVRPVKNTTDVLQVKFGANLCRLIDVDEVNQVLTTSLWLEMQWMDAKLIWDPDLFGGVDKVHIPSNQIWTPDILLYNNADGEPHIGIVSLLTVSSKGLVSWQPPSIYKSLCPVSMVMGTINSRAQIDIEYFPFDEQRCHLKFGGWTNDGLIMDLQQIPPYAGDRIRTMTDADGIEYQFLERGMGLSFFHESAEWDLLNATSARYVQIYPGCCGQQFYIDIRYNIVIRRKALFYTVILVVPCMLISNMITAVFLIPPREHKMTFSILSFVSLSVFYLVLIELIPPTSLVIPLIGKYLLFTLFMLCFAIFISVFNVNVYRRRQSTTYPMSRWKRWLFVETLPRYLHLKMLPDESGDVRRLSDDVQGSDIQPSSSNAHLIDGHSNQLDGSPAQFGCTRLRLLSLVEELQTKATNVQAGTHLALFRRMACNVALIGATFAKVELEGKVVNEWRLMSLVIDRLCLIAYLTLNIIATTMVILQSPALFDQRRALSRTIASRPLSGDTASMFP